MHSIIHVPTFTSFGMPRATEPYNAAMSRSRTLVLLFILLALAATVYAPVLISGLVSQQAAAAAIRHGEYGRAAAAFEFSGAETDLATAAMGDGRHGGLSGRRARCGNSDAAGGASNAMRFPRRAGKCSDPRCGRPACRRLAVETWLAGTQVHAEAPELWDRLAGAYHAQRDYALEQAALERRIELEDDAAARYRLGLLLVGWDDEHGAGITGSRSQAGCAGEARGSRR